jgi:hypothetical protein
VVLNEFYGANWTASMDGERIDTFPVNLNQVAIVTNGGDHIVTFEYRPLALKKLQWVQKTACGLLVCLALWNLGPKASRAFRKLQCITSITGSALCAGNARNIVGNHPLSSEEIASNKEIS